MELAARCRRLARVRYASLAAGEALHQGKWIERLNILNSHGVVFCLDIEKSVPAASEFICKQFQSKSMKRIYNHSKEQKIQWHNQRLNLTEPAVDDLTRAKQIATIGRDLPRAE